MAMETEPRDELQLRIEELRTERLARRVAGLVLLVFALLAVAFLVLALVAS
jgi:hypothetical protein